MLTLTAQDLEAILTPSLVVEALRNGFAAGVHVPLRHHHTIPTGTNPGTMLIMPAWNEQNDTAASVGVKLVNVYPQNASNGIPSIQGSYILFDKMTGTPKATMDGRTLTLFRTAAASVLAATYLAHSESTRLLMVGTGHLAPYIVRTYVEVLGVKDVYIWGRNSKKAAKMADYLTSDGLDAHPINDIAEGVRNADLVSCATMSTAPLVFGEWLQPGQHVDLIGGFTEDMRETDDEAIRKASLFVDTREGAISEAGDLIQPIRNGTISEHDIQADLEDLTTNKHAGRSSRGEITLFKSVGTALEDLVTAQLAYQIATDDSKGN